jgi:hypothetical protein
MTQEMYRASNCGWTYRIVVCWGSRLIKFVFSLCIAIELVFLTFVMESKCAEQVSLDASNHEAKGLNLWSHYVVLLVTEKVGHPNGGSNKSFAGAEILGLWDHFDSLVQPGLPGPFDILRSFAKGGTLYRYRTIDQSSDIRPTVSAEELAYI